MAELKMKIIANSFIALILLGAVLVLHALMQGNY
jgi:hypothetical protein